MCFENTISDSEIVLCFENTISDSEIVLYFENTISENTISDKHAKRASRKKINYFGQILFRNILVNIISEYYYFGIILK